MMQMNTRAYTQFQKKILTYYRDHGRTLPWRRNLTPYRVFVSEIMLQQTQVDRVIPKYNEFIRHFPSFSSLARAKRGEVLSLWSGLGYNRRAKYLHEAAKVIVNKYRGRLPMTESELVQLPGIGPYTAAAIAAFAYNVPSICIETNIRTVYIHEFFPNKDQVTDSMLLPFIEGTLYTKDPRLWYWALMDYGAAIKRQAGNQTQRSAHYTKQKPFKGSDREIRGAILKTLVKEPATTHELKRMFQTFDPDRIQKVLTILKREGLIQKKGAYYRV